MNKKIDVEVVIGGKPYTLSGYESSDYLQRIAMHINGKIAEFRAQEGYARLETELKNVLLAINLSDDYQKAQNTIREQSQYINMFKEQDMDAVILNHNIDSAFITQIEQQNQHIKFKRIDADVEDALKEDVDEKELDEIKTSLTDLFRKTLNKENLEVHVEKLKDAKISSIITLSEESRRMQDMMKMYAMPGMDPNMFGAPAQVLTLNANNTLVKYLFEHGDADNAKIICEQLYDLAMLSHTTLAPDEMTKFVQRSNEIMEMIAKF